MKLLDRILTTEFFGNTMLKYLISVLIFGLLCLLIWGLNRILKKTLYKLRNIEDNLGIRIAQFLLSRLSPILYFFAFFISLEQLNLPDFKTLLHSIDKGLIAVSIIYLFVAIIDFIYSEILVASTLEDNQKKLLRVLMISIKVIIILLGIVFVIKNFVPTFEITSILTTFGIGGVIVGLGLQNILQDVLNYFAIIFDNPFKEGEYILFGEFQGTISKIGIRSTRLISLSGEEINVPNSVITSQVIRNYSRLNTRRVQSKISIPFSIEKNLLDMIPKILESAILSVPNTVFSFARLSGFGNYSYDFTLAYYINETDYNKFMELQETANFAIIDILKKSGISIAYPIQIIRLEDNKK